MSKETLRDGGKLLMNSASSNDRGSRSSSYMKQGLEIGGGSIQKAGLLITGVLLCINYLWDWNKPNKARVR